jgi:hypothetical protein
MNCQKNRQPHGNGWRVFYNATKVGRRCILIVLYSGAVCRSVTFQSILPHVVATVNAWRCARRAANRPEDWRDISDGPSGSGVKVLPLRCRLTVRLYRSIIDENDWQIFDSAGVHLTLACWLPLFSCFRIQGVKPGQGASAIDSR